MKGHTGFHFSYVNIRLFLLLGVHRGNRRLAQVPRRGQRLQILHAGLHPKAAPKVRPEMNLLKSVVKSVAGPTKMVLVVRSDLGLKKGKIASQCAHAAVMCYVRSATVNESMLKRWMVQGQPKIVVKVDDLEGMERIAELAAEKKVVAEIVRDAGRTQVQSGTETVLGLGPDSAEVIDSLAGHLKLM